MRISAALLLVVGLLLSLGVGSADARRRATTAERAAIAAKFHAPGKCAIVYISTVDKHWATYAYNGEKYKDPDCKPYAADGVVILQFRGTTWHVVTAGSAFSCPVPKTPPKIVKDLHVYCVKMG
jgi:hypothetical protein